MPTTQKSPKRQRTPQQELFPDKRQHTESSVNGTPETDVQKQRDDGGQSSHGNGLASFVSGFAAGVKSSPSSPSGSKKPSVPPGITLSERDDSRKSSPVERRSDRRSDRSSDVSDKGTRTPSPSARSFARNSDTPPPADSALIEEILGYSSLYDILGVSKDCPVEEIRRAYLRRSRTVHPDRQGNNHRSTEAFQRLAAAYETLKEPKKRRLYDAQGDKGNFTGNGEETFTAAMSQVCFFRPKSNKRSCWKNFCRETLIRF